MGKGEEIASRLPAEKGDLRSPKPKIRDNLRGQHRIIFSFARDRGRGPGQSSLNLLTIAVASRHG